MLFSPIHIGSASIVHSSRVRTPKRHNSESVLYMSDDQLTSNKSNNNIKIVEQTEQASRNNHRLFPVSTYTETIKSPDTKHEQNNQQSIDKQSIR